MQPKTLVLTGYGINCEEETSYVFRKSGANADIVHVNDLIDGSKNLEDYQILAIPGGFSYGDDTGSGNAMANKIHNHFEERILKFAQEDKLIIGICNGFQILANTGLVPAIDDKYGERQVALMHNNTARYVCRWINLKMTSNKCVWTRGIKSLHCPVAHGEGNFYAADEVLEKLNTNDQVVWKYVNEDGSPANGQLPANPNGAIQDIAGVCDPSGRILGMMPHPERFLAFTNEDDWQLKKEKLIREGVSLPKDGAGLKVFTNAVEYFA